MRLDFKDILKKNVTQTLTQPRRSQVYVGYQCHQRCGFCYYKNHFLQPMFDKKYVLRQIDLELAYGIHDFEITGGEPSECNDLLFYCQYIKNKLPNAKIAIITNGGLYCYDDRIWNVIDEVLISCHTPKDNSLVDKKIFPLGTTFAKVKKTVDKARQFNKLIRTNTVVGTFNIDILPTIIDDVISLQPSIANILPINLFDDAYDMDQYIDYCRLRKVLKQQIDKISKSLPNSLSFVRYVPYCEMEGYEQHIISTWQHIYDWFDWNPELGGSFLLELIDKYKTNDQILDILGKYGSTSFDKSQICVDHHYEKSKKCFKCKYYLICEGVEKTKDHWLLSSVVPSYGKIENNIMKYIGTTIEDYYAKHYCVYMK